ncbi:PREDICTED: uclacyanin 1 [Nelumbo nucifera]|uniref:Uclacyanin 1 n=1 Tax=Nelumbo nucifera TaxID=4432 RepID=A0A1U7Z1T1_NELNU|nr:PREDICTED: uclacyanin 1 [Nelumbo nucifera]
MTELRTLLGLAALTMIVQLAVGADLKVGGSSGWDTTTDLQTWAASQSFFVGDSLIFTYSSIHDVLEVTKADYDSCSSSNPIKSYNDGNTTIQLSSPVKRYFICGKTGHCDQGMKLEVNVLASSTPPTASPVTPPAAPPPVATSTPPPSQKLSPSSPPSKSPALAPSKSPSSSPTPQTVPSTESPVEQPTRSPSSSAAPPPQPSSSSKTSRNLQVKLATGFSLGMMMVLAL